MNLKQKSNASELLKKAYASRDFSYFDEPPTMRTKAPIYVSFDGYMPAPTTISSPDILKKLREMAD
jgi:hypothetical protein